MKADFWHERWRSNQLGFHQTEVNDLLKAHWPTLALPRRKAAPVFVPLCGKSLDMTWLRTQGHAVVGVEISPIAVRDFFSQVELIPKIEHIGALERFSAGGYTLYCGDLFELNADLLGEVACVFDRASLIALPPELRTRYAKHFSKILPGGVEILLISLEYDQTRMSGPPHSVPPDEVERLFEPAFEIESLFTTGEQKPTPRFQERGLESWSEHVFRLRKRVDAT